MAAPHAPIREVSPVHVAGLIARGAMPPYTPDVDALTEKFIREPAPLGMVFAYRWYVRGPVDAPVGVLAVQERYDAAFGRHVLEIGDVFGTPMAVIRLLHFATDLSRERGVLLTGEVDIENLRMASALAKLGGEALRVRFVLEPK